MFNPVQFGLDDYTLTFIRRCLAVFPSIYEVKVYGSRAKGNYHPGSDIDLAVYSDEPIDNTVWSMLDALPLPYMFDVTDMSTLKHEGLREHIERVGQPIYQRGCLQNLAGFGDRQSKA